MKTVPSKFSFRRNISRLYCFPLQESLFDGLLDIHDQKTRLIWKILDRAAELIDQEMNLSIC